MRARRISAGRKRHILVDTLGLLRHVIVHPADIQDHDRRHPRNGDTIRAVSFEISPPFSRCSGYQGPKLAKSDLQKSYRISMSKPSNVPIGSAPIWLVLKPIQLDRRAAALHGSIAAEGLPRIGSNQPAQSAGEFLRPRINPKKAQKTMQAGAEVAGRTGLTPRS